MGIQMAGANVTLEDGTTLVDVEVSNFDVNTLAIWAHSPTTGEKERTLVDFVQLLPGHKGQWFAYTETGVIAIDNGRGGGCCGR